MAANYSFKKGWRQLPQAKCSEVRKQIMEALDIKVRTSFYPRLNGEVEPKLSEARDIERIFKQYGITDVWGE